MRRFLFVLLFAVLAAPAAVPAVDDMQAVTAVWADFTASLRRGDYRAAHQLFSPQSQLAMPYADFVGEYNPISVAREMILARPENQATNLQTDWAELTFSGTNPATGRPFRVGVSLVKNGGRWGLVAARNEERERTEAEARAVLAFAWNNRTAAPTLREVAAAIVRTQGNNPVFGYYRLESDGETFRMFPLQPGIRTFYVDKWGEVRSVEQTPPAPRLESAAALPVPERAPPQETPPPPVRDRNVMPELAEPPGPAGRPHRQSDPGEMPEPPEPPAPDSGRTRITDNPPTLRLPDTIH